MNYFQIMVAELLDDKAFSMTHSNDMIVANTLILIGEKEFNEAYECSLGDAYDTLKKPVDKKEFIMVAGQVFHKSLRQRDVFQENSPTMLDYYRVDQENSDYDFYDDLEDRKYIKDSKSLGGVFDMLLYNAIATDSRFWKIHKKICKIYFHEAKKKSETKEGEVS